MYSERHWPYRLVAFSICSHFVQQGADGIWSSLVTEYQRML